MAESSDNPTSQDQQNETQGSGETPQTWAEFAAAHPEAQKLHDAETAGLRSALDKERERAKTAEKSYRELAKTADPETAEKLRKLADETKAEAESLKSQLEFTAEAVKLGCRNVEKAWAVAQALGLTAEQIKADEDWSSLFAVPGKPRTNAGEGNGQGQAPFSMDELIRKAGGK